MNADMFFDTGASIVILLTVTTLHFIGKAMHRFQMNSNPILWFKHSRAPRNWAGISMGLVEILIGLNSGVLKIKMNDFKWVARSFKPIKLVQNKPNPKIFYLHFIQHHWNMICMSICILVVLCDAVTVPCAAPQLPGWCILQVPQSKTPVDSLAETDWQLKLAGDSH